MNTSRPAYLARRKVRHLPYWATKFLTGQAVSSINAIEQYARYYCVDGSVDEEEGEFEERIDLSRQQLCGYASRTGTKRNLAALREAGWRLLLSPQGVLRDEGFKYGLDNGAWTAYQQGHKLDESAFMRAVDKVGQKADWVVVPDIVAGGQRSLDYSLAWLDRLRGLPTQLLIAVQDGMSMDDVRSYLSPTVGIFIGGTSEWKEASAMAWGALARRRNCYLHVGRVNSQRRIAICTAAGANSFDGTSATRYAESLRPLDLATRQSDLYPASGSWAQAELMSR